MWCKEAVVVVGGGGGGGGGWVDYRSPSSILTADIN